MASTPSKPIAESNDSNAAAINANETIPQTIQRLRATFNGHATRSYEWRVRQLQQLRAMTIAKQDEIHAALQTDLRKCEFESVLSETGGVISDIDYALKHLQKWMRPRKVTTPIKNLPGSSRVVREPLGVVLIIAPWNYPFNLIISPLIGALAAGNCAVLKPSEMTPHVSKVVHAGIAEFLDTDAVCVIQGGADVATELLQQRFDHIFYTGGERVGKIVMTAAAQNLTPVTLELGGKSPCLIDHDADLEVAARRIAWGKFLNAGQTCVAPDYLLVHESVEADFLRLLTAEVKHFYGHDPQASPDYPRIISDSHFTRLKGLMDTDAVTVFGGQSDADDRYIAPTAIRKVALDAAIMEEEIFGPILPVIRVHNIQEGIQFVNQRPKPLALYLFANDNATQAAVVNQTSSGGVCINDVVMHLGVPGLPFGGVGTSGMGSYHGQASFETFSHAKSVLTKWNRFEVKLRYPPYNKTKLKWLRRFL